MDMYKVKYNRKTATVRGAGTQFKYTRTRNLKETVTATGPLTQRVEILVSTAFLQAPCELGGNYGILVPVRTSFGLRRRGGKTYNAST